MIGFNEAREFLATNGPVTLPYSTNKKVLFTASADICKTGINQGKPIIRIRSGKQSNILIYQKDWGQRYTRSGTLIYHACFPLIEYIEKQLM